MKRKNRIRGKKNRASGQRFERKTRKDLEEKGWIVDRWGNNIELPTSEEVQGIHMGHNKWLKKYEPTKGKLIPAKSRFGLRTTGFPDFIAYVIIKGTEFVPEIMGVECKSGKYLTKEEKEKCYWLLSNNIFSKVLIAYKSEQRGKIEYVNFIKSKGGITQMAEEEEKKPEEATEDKKEEETSESSDDSTEE